jgi:hypothetical protein
MGQPESYLIRVYRRAPDGRPSLAGVVRMGQERPFRSADELWAFLESASPSIADSKSAHQRRPDSALGDTDDAEGR